LTYQDRTTHVAVDCLTIAQVLRCRLEISRRPFILRDPKVWASHQTYQQVDGKRSEPIIYVNLQQSQSCLEDDGTARVLSRGTPRVERHLMRKRKDESRVDGQSHVITQIVWRRFPVPHLTYSPHVFVWLFSPFF
jgi:hypothetical protein